VKLEIATMTIQKAMNRNIEGSWPSFDEISKLGTERI
jgi:hypothetical protein